MTDRDKNEGAVWIFAMFALIVIITGFFFFVNQKAKVVPIVVPIQKETPTKESSAIIPDWTCEPYPECKG